ncbi:hypothetical protein SUGI_0820180 [Cryptomeria japonica]|nr:hypothetical protein SUGI_0820180 [Cryptomeria japonica]
MSKFAWSNRRILEGDVLAALPALNATVETESMLSISIALVDSPWDPYFQDEIAVGAFQAIKEDILVVCSANNTSLARGFIYNRALWIFTITVSIIDRDYEAIVKLAGDDSIFKAPCFYANENCQAF